MQAIVLVGGEGTRLRPLTYGTPKPMVPIMNVPFLARTMERLYEAGIRDVILPAGYMPQAIVDYFGDGVAARHEDHLRDRGDAARHGRRDQERRAAHYRTILRAQRRHAHEPRPARDAASIHEEKGGIGTLHLIPVDDPSAFGCVVHDANGRSQRVRREAAGRQEPTNEINAGTYLLELEILEGIPPGRNVSIERERFREVIADGKALYAYTTSDYWIDLGRPEQYLAAHRDMLSGAMPLKLEPGLTGDGGDGPAAAIPA